MLRNVEQCAASRTVLITSALAVTAVLFWGIKAAWESPLLSIVPDAVVSSISYRLPEDAGAQLEWGVRLRRAGKSQDAVTALGEAAQALPHSARAAGEYALALADVGDYRAAMLPWETARSLDPHAPSVRVFQARKLLASGDPLACVEELQSLLDRDPKQVEAWYVQAQGYRELHNSRAAMNALDHAMQIAPRWPLPYREAALALQGDGALGRAEPLARRALQLAPEDPRTALALAQILLDRGVAPTAVAEVESLLAKASGVGTTRQAAVRESGRLESLRERWSRAEWLLREACRLDPQDASARYHLIQVLRHSKPAECVSQLMEFQRLEEQERTERFLRGAVKEQLTTFQPRERLARFYVQSGRRERAAAVIDDYMRRVPGDARALAVRRSLQLRTSQGLVP